MDIENWFTANYLDGDAIQDGQMLSSTTCLEALTAQQSKHTAEVAAAVEQEAYLWFDAWLNYTKSSHAVSPMQDFGKWATERLQEHGATTPTIEVK